MEPSNEPIHKRKPAAASLFIKNKKPPASSIGDGIKAGEKKESVKQRLARQMVSISNNSILICNSVRRDNGPCELRGISFRGITGLRHFA
jgi:hypothetical protein